MKMETPKKQNAHSISHTLKDYLNNEDYIKALRLIEQHQQIRLRNGLYPTDNDYNSNSNSICDDILGIHDL